MRSLLLLGTETAAGLRPALISGADGVALDLAAFDGGRSLPELIGALAASAARPASDRPKLLARVRPLASGRTDDDLAAVMVARPDAIILPGTEGGRDLGHLAAKLAVHEAERDLPDGQTGIIASIDSPAALLALSSLAGREGRLSGILLDTAALQAALCGGTGGEDVRETDAIRHARSIAVLVARACQVPLIERGSGVARGREAPSSRYARLRREGVDGVVLSAASDVPIANAAFPERPVQGRVGRLRENLVSGVATK